MPWLLLILAGLLEIAWAFGLKRYGLFQSYWPSLAIICAMLGSFWLLALAMRQIPLGTAYSVWTGIGVLGAVLLGAILLDEKLSLLRLACIALLLLSILGLRLLR